MREQTLYHALKESSNRYCGLGWSKEVNTTIEGSAFHPYILVECSFLSYLRHRFNNLRVVRVR